MKRMNFPRRRQQRQIEATERQSRYEQLTLDEKIAQATKRGTDGCREVAKLKKQLVGAGGSHD